MFWKKKRRRTTNTRLPLTRFIGPVVTILGLLGLLGFGVTKGVDLSRLDDEATTPFDGVEAQPTAASVVGTAKPADRIRIASFNIKVFGEKKSSNANVMNVLGNIVTQFDVVAIQEVRSPHLKPVDQLVALINQHGGRYAATVSKSMGRSSQTEQYAYVYDTTRIRLLPGSSYVVNDEPDDRMHREPMVATFETLVPAETGRTGFKFTIINAHTDPDEVKTSGPDNELNVLDDVYLSVREYEYARQGEDDFLLVGDLNVDGAHLGELGAIRGIVSVTGNVPTNTLGTEVYDHILVDRSTTSEFTGVAGVIDYVSHLGLTPEQAAMVSDHKPIWAEFSAYEQPAFSAVAARPATTR